MSDAGEVRVAQSQDETGAMMLQGLEGIIEKVPNLWTIISCLQQMNCLNQRRNKSSTEEVACEEKRTVNKQEQTDSTDEETRITDNQEEADSIDDETRTVDNQEETNSIDEEIWTVDNQEETGPVQSHEDRCPIESTEENLNMSQEGSSTESEKEDDPVQQAENEASQRMTKRETIYTLILCFTPWFLYPRFANFNHDQSFWFTVVLANVLIFACFYIIKRMDRGSRSDEDEQPDDEDADDEEQLDNEDEQLDDEDAQPDDEDEQPRYEASQKTSWTRAKRIVSNIGQSVGGLMFALGLTDIIQKYIGYEV